MIIKTLADLRKYIEPFTDECPIGCLGGNANVEIEYKHNAKNGGWIEIRFPTPVYLPKKISGRKIV